MGKRFESPAIVSLALEDTEGAWTANNSGDTPTDDVEVRLKYDDFDSGSLTVMTIYMTNNSKEDKWHWKIYIALQNGMILDPDYNHNCSGQFHELTKETFWLEWNNKVEPAKTENFQLQLKVKNGPRQGAMDWDTAATVAADVYFVDAKA